RVLGENVIDLYLDGANVPDPGRQQAGKDRAVEHRVLGEDKVIGRLDLNLVSAFRTGGGGHSAIRIARREEVGIRESRARDAEEHRHREKQPRRLAHNDSPLHKKNRETPNRRLSTTVLDSNLWHRRIRKRGSPFAGQNALATIGGMFRLARALPSVRAAP